MAEAAKKTPQKLNEKKGSTLMNPLMIFIKIIKLR